MADDSRAVQTAIESWLEERGLSGLFHFSLGFVGDGIPESWRPVRKLDIGEFQDKLTPEQFHELLEVIESVARSHSIDLEYGLVLRAPATREQVKAWQYEQDMKCGSCIRGD